MWLKVASFVLLKSPSDGETTAHRQHHYPDNERDTRCAMHFLPIIEREKKRVKSDGNRKLEKKRESKRRSSERGKRRRINKGGGECDGG